LNSLNFPYYEFKTKNEGNKLFIFDEIRKKYVSLSPEEWVRQHTIKYLINEKSVPSGLMFVEQSLTTPDILIRADIVLYNREGNPLMIVECKAPEIKITEKTFDQAATYNFSLKVSFFLITNGLNHYSCKLDYINKKYTFLKTIPSYNEMINNTAY